MFYLDTPNDIEEAEPVATTDEEAIVEKPSSTSAAAALALARQQPSHPPSFFTNERGNLKAVAFVIRNPCAIFWLLIVMCFVISFMLQVLVFREYYLFLVGCMIH